MSYFGGDDNKDFSRSARNFFRTGWEFLGLSLRRWKRSGWARSNRFAMNAAAAFRRLFSPKAVAITLSRLGPILS